MAVRRGYCEATGTDLIGRSGYGCYVLGSARHSVLRSLSGKHVSSLPFLVIVVSMSGRVPLAA